MSSHLIPAEVIEKKIYVIRDQKVMFDRDLAELYGVQTRDLNKAVRRNLDRFPNDFMFQLSKPEYTNLMFQSGTSSWGGTRKLPFVFTQEGVAMLSSVLNSKRAIYVNIQIMRTFIKFRQMAANYDYRNIQKKIEEMESKYDHQFGAVFNVIKKLLRGPKEKFPKVKGFVKNGERKLIEAKLT